MVMWMAAWPRWPRLKPCSAGELRMPSACQLAPEIATQRVGPILCNTGRASWKTDTAALHDHDINFCVAVIAPPPAQVEGAAGLIHAA